MFKLNEGNVLLKPCQRRQLMASLRRAMRLGSRLGKFMLTISLRRAGRAYEVVASVQDSRGEFRCRSRQNDWRGALRDLTRSICQRLHDQCVRLAVA